VFDPINLATFFLVVVGLIVIPGPAVLLTLARAIRDGRRVGLATGLGIAAGDLVHTLFAAIGLSALLMTSALAFEIVKYAGVAYLLYLGLRSFFEKTEALSIPSTRRLAPAVAFRQAVLAEVLNPKTALFFLAFLPQFVEPAGPHRALAFLELGCLFNLTGTAWNLVLARLGSAAIARRPRALGLAAWFSRGVGALFVGLGIRLALATRASP